MATTHDNLNDLFEDIATSIRAKTGSSATMTAHQMPAQIDSIVTDPSGSCTATDSDILSGKTAYAGGVLRTGNIASYNKDYEVTPEYLCFTANTAGSTVTLFQKRTPSVAKNFEYSTDKNTWTSFSLSSEGNGPTITLTNIGDKVYLRGNNVTLGESGFIFNKFIMTGSIAASGNINTLLTPDGERPSLANTSYCYIDLFQNCSALTSAPSLPSTTLGEYCYYYMFDGCTNLTTLPSLPAMNLAEGCYRDMFARCGGITTVDKDLLPATSLAPYCYGEMFSQCTGLLNSPKLPAMNLATSCYYNMFYFCTHLAKAPDLPAITAAPYCYQSMFYYCPVLTQAPSINLQTSAEGCCMEMFLECSALTTVPVLHLTNVSADAFFDMFNGCTSLYISDTQTVATPYQWAIPRSWVFTTTTSHSGMFASCLGTRSTNSPTFTQGTSAIYWTQNPPIM